MSRAIQAQIRRAILDEGSVDVPEGMRPVQIQSWAHTKARRMGLVIKTRKVAVTAGMVRCPACGVPCREVIKIQVLQKSPDGCL